MTGSEREQRLQAELDSLRELAGQSEIMDFEAEGEPPTKYVLSFRGKALKRDLSDRGEVEVHDLHQCEIRLPYSFPDRPPDVRWMTPIFHPNVSFSGLIRLGDIGMAWDRDLGLSVLCERLWDMARYAFVDLDKAANFSARNWADGVGEAKFPIDPRPLRGEAAAPPSNVIRYERRGAEGIKWTSSAGSGEVFYIDEDTPVPPMPERKPPSDDDILYIGDEE